MGGRWKGDFAEMCQVANALLERVGSGRSDSWREVVMAKSVRARGDLGLRVRGWYSHGE